MFTFSVLQQMYFRTHSFFPFWVNLCRPQIDCECAGAISGPDQLNWFKIYNFALVEAFRDHLEGPGCFWTVDFTGIINVFLLTMMLKHVMVVKCGHIFGLFCFPLTMWQVIKPWNMQIILSFHFPPVFFHFHSLFIQHLFFFSPSGRLCVHVCN